MIYWGNNCTGKVIASNIWGLFECISPASSASLRFVIGRRTSVLELSSLVEQTGRSIKKWVLAQVPEPAAVQWFCIWLSASAAPAARSNSNADYMDADSVNASGKYIGLRELSNVI